MLTEGEKAPKLTCTTYDGRPIDVLTVAERLKDAGQLDSIGGPVFLDRLIDFTPTAAHAEYYIDIVRQKHLLRAIGHNLSIPQQAARHGDVTALP